MNAVDLFTVGVWLSAAVGLWLIRIAVSYPPKTKIRYRFGSAGLLLIVLPVVGLLFVFFRHSVAVMATEYAFIAGFGILMLIGAWRGEDVPRYKLILVVVIGFASLGWGLWHLAGDFLLRRPSIEGYVTDKRYEARRPGCRRCLPDYYLDVGGRRYLATARVFQAVDTGRRIRAKIGRASRRILWFEARPF